MLLLEVFDPDYGSQVVRPLSLPRPTGARQAAGVVTAGFVLRVQQPSVEQKVFSTSVGPLPHFSFQSHVLRSSNQTPIPTLCVRSDLH